MLRRLLRTFQRRRKARPARLARAVALIQEGAAGPAESELRLALTEDPDNLDALHLLGTVLSARGEHVEAAALLARCVEAAPDASEAHLHLAAALVKMGRDPDAEQALRAAVACAEYAVPARNALGNFLVRQHRFEDALAEYGTLIAEAPESIEGWINHGNVLRYMGSTVDACRSYERALQLAPTSADARYHYALALLANREWQAGWNHYEARFTYSGNTAEWRTLPFQAWEGQPVAGRKILLWREQGLGDEIMFGSCIADLLNAGAKVAIECSAKLESIFRMSFPGALVYARPPNRSLPSAVQDCDFHAPLGVLPRYVRRSDAEFPERGAYLVPDPARLAYWRERLATLGRGLKVGVSWRGGTPKTHRSIRSVPLERGREILNTPGAVFVNLQYADKPDDHVARAAITAGIVDFPETREDYAETAALVGALDLVISVCTAVIHLGGALGRPVWVLTPSIPEWRYGIAGDTMPWYSSVRIFRQPADGDWDAVISRIAAELAAYPATAAP